MVFQKLNLYFLFNDGNWKSSHFLLDPTNIVSYVLPMKEPFSSLKLIPILVIDIFFYFGLLNHQFILKLSIVLINFLDSVESGAWTYLHLPGMTGDELLIALIQLLVGLQETLADGSSLLHVGPGVCQLLLQAFYLQLQVHDLACTMQSHH